MFLNLFILYSIPWKILPAFLFCSSLKSLILTLGLYPFFEINLSAIHSTAGIPPNQIADVAYSSMNFSLVASLASSLDSFLFSFLAMRILEGASIPQSLTING